MTAQEMKAQFTELYNNMKEGKDVSKMIAFGTAFSQMFDKVATAHPDIAAATLEFLSSMEYHNFVTPAEATMVATKFINDDMAISGASQPSKGPHWSMETLRTFLSAKGLPTEEKPYYNWPALWLTVNMEYSDYAEAFAKLMGAKDNESLATASYTMAVKKLKDRDRPKFIREYFDLDE
jgi:hypothetical protein